MVPRVDMLLAVKFVCSAVDFVRMGGNDSEEMKRILMRTRSLAHREATREFLDIASSTFLIVFPLFYF